MNQYRALFIDPGDTKKERPVQIVTNSRSDVDDWATKKLDASISPEASVLVFQSIEQQVALITKKGKPE